MNSRLLAVAASCVLGAACVGGPGDRCYVESHLYREARRAYERAGSIELVRQALSDAHWPNCKVNEAVYRIEKEFGLNDELPSPVRTRSEEELLMEEAMDKTVVEKPIGEPSLPGRRRDDRWLYR